MNRKIILIGSEFLRRERVIREVSKMGFPDDSQLNEHLYNVIKHKICQL